MKIKVILLILLLACSVTLQAKTKTAQNSIVGTWKMVEQTGIYADGSSVKPDFAKLTQYKMITPTHWMFVAYNSDSLKGIGESGEYTLKGNEYVETLSWAKTDYTLRVEGGKFYMNGFIIYPDGKKMELHEVYEKVAETSTGNADVVGTWNMTSLTAIKDGKKVLEKINELQIITPSQYMWVDKKDGQVVAAMYGTYTKQGNKVVPTPVIATFPVSSDDKVEINVSVKGDQMLTKGTMTKKDGTSESWECVHQRVGKAKLAKATSNL